MLIPYLITERTNTMQEAEIKTTIVNTIKDILNHPRPYLNRVEIAKYFGVASFYY